MMIIFCFAVFVLRARLEGQSAREAEKHARFYLRGRQGSTLSTYNTEYRKLASYCIKKGWLVVSLSERQVVSFIISRAEKGVSQGQLGQVCSVINILSEVCGFVSPVQSPVVSKVKMAAIKEANFGKKKTVRKGMTLQLMKIIIDSCYKRNSSLVLPERRRFLIMQLFCFFGVRRFNDIQFVKRKNVVRSGVKRWLDQECQAGQGCQGQSRGY